MAVHIAGTEETDGGEEKGGGGGAGWTCDTPGRTVSFQRQHSSTSPPTSTESLQEHTYSSGVDSPPAQSTSDIMYTPRESNTGTSMHYMLNSA